jgi:hypothetical protein
MNILLTIVFSLFAAYAYAGIEHTDNQALFVICVMCAGIFAIYEVLDSEEQRITREYDEQTRLND